MASEGEDGQRARRNELVEEVVSFAWLIVIALSVAFFLVMPDFSLSPTAFDNVSRYYGPGPVTAWLVLSLGNSEFKFLLKFVWRRLRRQKAISVDDFDSKLDFTFVGTVAYPLVAFTDLIIQIATSFRSRSLAQSASMTLDAQLSVLHLSSAVSTVALGVHVFCLQDTFQDDNESDFDRKRHEKCRRKRKIRLALWSMVFVCSQICLSIINFSLRSRTIANLKYYSKHYAMGLLGLVVLSPDSATGRNWKSFAWIAFIVVFLQGVPMINLDVHEKVGVRLAFPRTSAKISDLDQAAALALALCTLGLSVAGSMTRGVGAHSTLDAEKHEALKSNQENHTLG